MADIKVRVHTPGGESHPIEAPFDIRVDELIEQLVTGLNLPKLDAEGHPVTWVIDDKDIGKSLEYQSTLEASGVREGHHLYMRRQVTAGIGGERFIVVRGDIDGVNKLAPANYFRTER